MHRRRFLSRAGTLSVASAIPSLASGPGADEPLPTEYVRSLPGSNVVRIRRGDRDATILGGQHDLLHVQ